METMAAVNVLLITNDAAVAETIRASLAAADSGSFRKKWVRRLSDGLGYLRKGESAAVLVELSLPDSDGIETFYKVFNVAPEVPMLIVGGNLQETLAKEAVAYGAHDYILPVHMDSYSLPRALRNAIERKSVEDALYVEKERALVTFNSIGDAVLCTNISGEITYLNLVAETMTGWGREEAIGKPLSQVFKIVDASTRGRARSAGHGG